MKVLNVHIGEIKTGGEDAVLKAILGSCVGIALLWKSKGIYGLAHCLLGEAPESFDQENGRYVSLAVPAMLKLMNASHEEYSEIEAIIAGGGNMTNPNPLRPNDLIGTLNTNAAKRYLKLLRIPIIKEDIGGIVGRRIRIICATGEVEIESIPRISAAS